ncbi:hypothetical protein QBC43DRAFT_296865 [Cladorrhinum sp. PSN259]|nr:hypothetical protein QBC43DRAFT_296865 [Cladorrhinum sp. PSN259]
MAAPISSQFSPGFASTFKKADDLSDTHKRSCDDLIIRFHEALALPSPGHPTTTAARGSGSGFSKTKTRIVPSHTQNDNLTIGNPTTPSKRKQSAQSSSTALTQTKRERMVGAAAYMKPNLNWDDFGISFPICDVNGSSSNARFVNWNPGWTPSQARVQAMTNWDTTSPRGVVGWYSGRPDAGNPLPSAAVHQATSHLKGVCSYKVAKSRN